MERFIRKQLKDECIVLPEFQWYGRLYFGLQLVLLIITCMMLKANILYASIVLGVLTLAMIPFTIYNMISLFKVTAGRYLYEIINDGNDNFRLSPTIEVKGWILIFDPNYPCVRSQLEIWPEPMKVVNPEHLGQFTEWVSRQIGDNQPLLPENH